MPGNETAGFAFVRKAECEALTRCKPSAALALIFIRSNLATREDQPFSCGSRDFKPCGLGRDASESALRELVRERIIEMVSEGSFTRGKKARWRLVHTRASARNTAGKPANCKSDTAGKPANSGRKTRQLDENTAGKSATPKETSSTSSQKSKEEEVSLNETEKLSAQRREAERDQNMRIGKAAEAIPITSIEFVQKAGGWEAADFLAKRFLSGKLTLPQLRKKLAESAAGLRMGLGKVSPKHDSGVSPDASGAQMSKRLAVRR